MKLASVMMIVGILQVSATSNAQKLSLKQPKATLEEVFEQLRVQTGYKILCNADLIKSSPSKDVDFKNADIQQILHAYYPGKDFTVTLKNKTIVIKQIPGVKLKKSVDNKVLPQPVELTGIVTDSATGGPLAGVTVQIKGNNKGTTTDGEGKFRLSVPDDAVLIVSYIGYKTKEVVVDKQTELKVSLAKSSSGLNEVVVIGYGTVRKKDLTGAISSISAKELNSGGAHMNVDQMLQGKVPGVQITQSSSEPGGGVSIRIRGTNSLTASNDPLYVIDGVPLDNSSIIPAGPHISGQRFPRNPLNTLNPNDIQSIEVLKDASATAIYGSRGANGVILITTKKGNKGGLRVNYSGYGSVQNVAKRVPVLSAPQYMSFLNGLRKSEGQPLEFSQDEINKVGKGTDWEDEVFRTGSVQDHQLSFSGGSETTNYYVSLNYHNEQGVVISSGIKRYSTHLHLDHSLNNFSFGINLNASVIKNNFTPSGIGVNGDNAGVISNALQMDPTMAIQDSLGNYIQSNVVDLENPMGLAKGEFDNAETNRLYGNVFAEYTIFKNIKAKIDLGIDRSTGRRDVYANRETKRGAGTNGNAYVGGLERYNYVLGLTVHYDKYFGPSRLNHINAMLGYTYQEFDGRGFNSSAQNFPTDAFETNNLAAGNPSTYLIGSDKFKHQLLSYLGRINYTYKDRYLATLSFRADGSSRFGLDQKYGYFPSLALGWRLGKEPFISQMNIFSLLKLRASYGITGNQDIGNYKSLVLLGSTGSAIFDESLHSGIAPIQLGNANLKWESTEQYNIGLDYGFLNGRITGTIDYYFKHTSNLLLQLPIPTTTGFATSLQNVGSTNNKGFEIQIKSQNLVNRFSWSTTFNFTANKNRVSNLGTLPFIMQGGIWFADNFSILRVGAPVGAYFGYKVDGIFQSEEDIKNSAQPNSKPGELKYDDVNQDGKITTDDRVILGSPQPDFTFGLNNDFTYRGFDLSIFLEGKYGNDLFNFNRYISEYPISFRRNREAYVMDRWTPENPTSKNPSFVPPSVAYGSKINSRVVEDASYLRFKNIRLSYHFPNLKSKAIHSLSLYVSAQNLITITNYSGFDPDVNSMGDSNIIIDFNSYPLSRIYTLGVNIGF